MLASQLLMQKDISWCRGEDVEEWCGGRSVTAGPEPGVEVQTLVLRLLFCCVILDTSLNLSQPWWSPLREAV